MKQNNRGFNIIELMVAISISAILIASVVKSFASLYKLYAFNSKILAMNHEMRLALQVMERDINDAGIFGNFSLHNSSDILFNNVNFIGGSSCNSPWCNLDVRTVGVKSSLMDVDSVTHGYSLEPDSEVLKVQSDGGKIAYAIARDIDSTKPMISKCNSGTQKDKLILNNILLSSDSSSLDQKANFFILSSANSAYLINKATFTQGSDGFSIALSGVDGCPNQGDGFIEAHSNVYSKKGILTQSNNLVYDSIDPDIHSMVLTNLITNYYFVASGNDGKRKGLYRVSSNGGELSNPELISTTVDQIKISYLLDFSETINRSGKNSSQRYTVCTTGDMTSGRADCLNQWGKVVAITIDLSASDPSASIGSDSKEGQSVRETISWKS
jgi:prepilin-type N-terminal cleavage/methylation domain-containing protein